VLIGQAVAVTEQHVLRSESIVDQALHRADLVPPEAGPALGDGNVARLRSQMARFSSGNDHATSRAAVESAISRIDRDRLARLAAEETLTAMAEGRVGIDELAATVPTRAVARSLGAERSDLSTIWTAVEAVAGAIGRGHEVDEVTDQRCAWLLNRFVDHPDGAVAAVSVLYQNRDATEALLLASVDHATAAGNDPRKPAVSGTVRQATTDLTIGSVRLAAGELVRLEFTMAQEFGAGPHHCPGELLARCIVEAILNAVARDGAD
jgi:cytochrome P450